MKMTKIHPVATQHFRRIAFLASLVGVLHVGAAPFIIAQRGQPANCVIVLPSAPSEAESYAAQELQNFTKRMTGVELPVASAPVDGKNAVILSKSRKDLPRDAFHLAVKGNRLVVEAGSDSGVLYGVYELLERHGGCRWYSSWCEKVPSVETFSVPDALNDTQNPAFLMREPFWADMIRNPDFACRNRVNGGEWMSFKAKHGGTPYRYGDVVQGEARRHAVPLRRRTAFLPHVQPALSARQVLRPASRILQ